MQDLINLKEHGVVTYGEAERQEENEAQDKDQGR